jgi:hypothetical protein
LRRHRRRGLILRDRLTREGVPAQERVELLQALHRSLLRHSVVLDGLVDDVLLLLLLQCPELVLLPEYVLLGLKLLPTKLPKLPTHLTREAVRARGLLQPLKPGTYTLQAEPCALHACLRTLDARTGPLDTETRALHACLRTLNTHPSALHAQAVELTRLLDTLHPRLLALQRPVDA